MESEKRTENEIFSELESICQSSGYVHAIAYFCFRDNTIGYTDEMNVDDVLRQYTTERLVRTEISTIIGLACKTTLDTTHPGPAKIQEYIDRTDALLLELHKAMMPPIKELIDPNKLSDPDFNPFKNGDMLRESIFYGGESAYNFQYKDLSLIKYKHDSKWFQDNKGYSVEQAWILVSSLGQLQNNKINKVFPALTEKHPNEWTIYPSFTFTAEELSELSGIEISITKSFIESFVVPESIDNNTFAALDDFNPLNAYPIIKVSDTEYLLFQNYSLVEAMYETPFFWFNDDKGYKNKAKENRGLFTEKFSEERLKLVFGENRVFTNIDIYKDKKTRVGEIDVLVVFSNRAIVLQAKSKKLTIAARKGNDNCLREDFKKAVQDAYDQAFSCSEFLNDQNYKLIDSDGNELTLNRNYREIYPFCVISDHYPALSFQARQFLKYNTTNEIMPPFIMDVFLLDVMTEMLQSPLYFLSYINRRVTYSERILSNHELTILSYHLKQNLWIENDVSMIQLGDDICADLDLSMLNRRYKTPGVDTPDGILTKFRGTTFGQIINEIDNLDDPATIDLGFMLLSLSSDTVNQINNSIDHLCNLHMQDSKHHDLTLGFDKGQSGLTIHCNSDRSEVSAPRLRNHCHKRKYALKAKTWFGLCIVPKSKRIKFGLELSFDWEQSDQMDELTKDLPAPQILSNGRKFNFRTKKRHGRKIGRNEPCPCGSGKKYKKCCLN
ncbi:SEC-C metal-binding domain-containing protein [Desulfoluna butyratoxydans]|uniref:Sec-c motif n=1 Tax=Desulfoluna butyratoxydans TaxID=231438 RepID=A0A4U8YP07_9BACT|nr:SEC-C metal-binding domain-containing protein [Desulfoluna butyratoxydans]VFQ45394.1 sec-c motif [Desulfoluna butyratoxydans]